MSALWTGAGTASFARRACGTTRRRELVLSAPRNPGPFSPAETAGVLSRTIAELPVFCDLLTHVPLSLEGDVDMERARRYKINAFAAYDDMARHLEAVSVMSSARVADLITIALTANLWQVAHPTPTLAALYAGSLGAHSSGRSW
ncbi:hypothetical protein ACSHWB_01195 [Lentzea sp. HUAS TT2]|uniref:hypothetical protein n=1 Tax=Lentzea sp. HUAS TT2 TaxID=3447454 RepID=UPI003F72D884